MAQIKPHTLSGFMELLPQPQLQMEAIMEVLRRTYGLYGFTPLDTPAIEAADVLLAKGGGETEKQIYRFQKGDSDLALRFDLTVPLAKYVALHYGELSFPFRRYQIGKVYRGERAQRGRFREFYQADIDIIGDGKLSITNEAEIPSIIYRTFSTLGLRRFQIRVNNRKILNGFYAMLGLSEKAGDIMRTVDKLDKIGPDKVRTLLVDECGVEADKADEILRFIAIRGTNDEVLAALEQYRGKDGTFDLGLDELSAVTKLLGAFGVPEENFAVDLTIARGLDYYTGTVYETTLLDHPEIGSVCSGGRYDNLAGYYTDRTLPGVGISIGVTRLFYVLQEQDMLSKDILTAPAEAVVIPMDTDCMAFAVETATALRAEGVKTQIYFENRKFKQKIGFADKSGIPFALIIGGASISIPFFPLGMTLWVPALGILIVLILVILLIYVLMCLIASRKPGGKTILVIFLLWLAGIIACTCIAIRENVGDRIRTRHSVIERMLNSEIIIDNDTTTVERLLEEYDSQNVIEDGRKTLHISVPNQSIDITIDREKAGLEVKANGKRVKVQTGGDKTESAEPDSVRQPDAGRVPAEQTE